MSIVVENLTKIYGTQKALDQISFSIEKGEIVGFLGPNGAGKSTTMKILSCYTSPDFGNALVNGFNIIDEPAKVRRQIGYLPERNPLYDDMFIREYLLFSARIHGLPSPKNSRIEELMHITGLIPEKNKKIGQLSKGYRQRVGLAQAIIHNPDVLLLDEPTSGLDPNQIIEIRNLIKELGKQKTIMLSSHIMQEVQAMCTRIIIINKGQIVADNSTNELIRQNEKTLRLKVEFKNKVNKPEIERIAHVLKVASDGNKWIISSNNETVRESLYGFAVQTGNVILEMTTLTDNLENIFQKLTTE